MKVSIIIPIYKSEKYLEKCLKSIQNQTYKDFECLMINDGSPDNSEEICKKYVEGDSRFKLFSKENEGAYKTANFGFDHASGDFVTVVDADDYVEKEWLEERIKEIQKFNADTVFCGYRAVDMNYNERLIEKPNYKNKIYENGEKKELIERIIGYSCNDLYRKLKGENDCVQREFASVWRFLYDNKVFQENKIRFDERANLVGDVLVNSEYLSVCKKVVISETYGYNYLYRDDGLVQSFLNSKAIDFWNDKMASATAREEANEKLLNNMDVDFFYAWEGSNIFSSMEIGLRFSNDKELSLRKKIKMFKSYIKLDSTKRAFKDLKMSNLNMKYKICFICVKMHLLTLEYLMIEIANRLGLIPKMEA